ncbi:MAG: pilus assembly FimT family protein [Longimicrobiales bacterium]
MARCRSHSRAGGFTLLEVLIVMVIASIAVMMAAPSIGSSVRQSHAQQAAATIAQDIQRALSTASRTHRPVVVEINTDSMVYRLVDRVDGTVYATQHLAPGRSEFALTSITTTATRWDLLPNGTAAGAYQMTIQAGDNRRRIILTRAGLVRVIAI